MAQAAALPVLRGFARRLSLHPAIQLFYGPAWLVSKLEGPQLQLYVELRPLASGQPYPCRGVAGPSAAAGGPSLYHACAGQPLEQQQPSLAHNSIQAQFFYKQW